MIGGEGSMLFLATLKNLNTQYGPYMQECANEMTGKKELRRGCGRVCIITDSINDGNPEYIKEIRKTFDLYKQDA